MTTIVKYRSYAQAALASYAASLVQGSPNNADRYRQTRVGMTESQAAAFDATWNVLQQSTPTADGFSAVLFQNRVTNEKVFAIAGTDPSSIADYVADFIDIAVLGSVATMPQYRSLESFHAQLVSSGKLGASEKVVVAGHSLGGFLAQAFTARRPSAVSAAYTYNAPGFGGATALLNFLGISSESTSVEFKYLPDMQVCTCAAQ